MPLQFFCVAQKQLRVYCKSSPMHGCKERVKAQRSTKVALTVATAISEKAHFKMKQH